MTGTKHSLFLCDLFPKWTCDLIKTEVGFAHCESDLPIMLPGQPQLKKVAVPQLMGPQDGVLVCLSEDWPHTVHRSS